MSHLNEFYFIAIAFISELVGSISGVSTSALFVPLALLVEPLKITLALTAVLHVFGNSVRTIYYRKEINWILTFKFGLPAILFSGLGAEYSDFLPKSIHSIILGLFLTSLSIYFLFINKNEVFSGRWIPYIGGAVSGLLTGLLGSGGAVRTLALTTFNLSPVAFVATSTLIDFGGDIVRLFIYLKKGYLTADHYFYIPILMAVVVIANWLGKKVLRKISTQHFRRAVLYFVLAMGLSSLITGGLNGI